MRTVESGNRDNRFKYQFQLSPFSFTPELVEARGGPEMTGVLIGVVTYAGRRGAALCSLQVERSHEGPLR